MTKEDVLQYCFYFKDEPTIPSAYNHKIEGKLWVAEKFVCEKICRKIDEENPRKSIASYIAAYVGKWSPYEFSTIIEAYLKNTPDLRDYILTVYS